MGANVKKTFHLNRLVCILISIIFVFSAMPVTAFAEEKKLDSVSLSLEHYYEEDYENIYAVWNLLDETQVIDADYNYVLDVFEDDSEEPLKTYKIDRSEEVCNLSDLIFGRENYEDHTYKCSIYVHSLDTNKYSDSEKTFSNVLEFKKDNNTEEESEREKDSEEPGDAIDEDYEDEIGPDDELLTGCQEGIMNNGLDGLYIDINSAPYTTYANNAGGSVAYTSVGCTWFVAARVNQLTGKTVPINGANYWYNTQYKTLGFTRGQELRAKSVVCYKGSKNNHVAIIEKVSGNNVLVSEGGISQGSDAAHGHCVIRWKTKSQVENFGSFSLIGYVYFAETAKNPKIAFDYAGQDEKGNILVTGWAFDEDDVNQAIAVHVYAYVNKDYNTPYFVGETIANVYRSDVNDAFGCGNYHGFSASFPPPVYGTVEVNVAAINIGSGDNVWSTAKTITVEKRGLAIIYDNFPDVNFRSAITRYFDTDKNGFLSDEELAGAKEISVSDCTDFSGIEYFTELESINIRGPIRKLNFDNNTKLKKVSISTGEDYTVTTVYYDDNWKEIIKSEESTVPYDPNNLHHISFKNNPELESLQITSGSISSIDVDNNYNLRILRYHGSRIEQLNLCNNKKLEELSVGGDKSSGFSKYANHTAVVIKSDYLCSIKSINIEGLENLEYFNIDRCSLVDEFSIVDCDSLECIYCSNGYNIKAKKLIIKECDNLDTILDPATIVNGGYLEVSDNPVLTSLCMINLQNDKVVIRNNPNLRDASLFSPELKQLNIADGNPILVDLVKTTQPTIQSASGYNKAVYQRTNADGKQDSLIVAENTEIITDKVLTGNVTINGTCKYGQVLTANVTECNAASLSYQWMRGTSAINGATSNTYKLVAADIGKRISCIVTDMSGDAIGSISSPETNKIEKADSPAAPSGVKGVATTKKGSSDGKITGVTTAMEYSSQANFSGGGVSCTSTTVTGLKAGTYYVRLKETTTTKAGKAVKVVVEEGKETDVTLIFTDVKAGSWYVNAVQYAYDNGIMSGTGSNTFSPNSSLTRGQLVTILYSMAGKPKTTYQANFDDVKQSDYFALPVTWAYANGVTSGNGNGKFSPNAKITREQLAVMLYKYASLKDYSLISYGKALDSFPDKNKVSSYATDAMKWAVTQEIISGKGDGRLDPQGNATRAECAAMVMKLLQKNGQ